MARATYGFDVPYQKKSCVKLVSGFLSSFLFLAGIATGCSTADGASVQSTSGTTSNANSAGLTISGPSLLASHAQIAAVSPPNFAMIDAPVVSLMSGGERRFVSTSVRWFKDQANKDDFNVFHSLIRGTFDNPFQKTIQIKDQSQYFSNLADFPGKWWIVNTYQEGDDVLAFVHVEFARGITSGTRKLGFGSTYIGLAWSGDGGKSFRYLGNVISPQNEPEDHNIEGAPFLIKDGFFYVYFLDIGGVAMARASKDAVLSAARNGSKMPEWQKYNNGSWTPGLGGASSNIGVQGITHGDAAYSTATRKYYMATTSQKSGQSPSQISLFESSDALSWRPLQRIAPLNDVKLGWQYLSIFDKSGSDNAVVGDEFNIVVGKEPIDTTKSELYRFSVNLLGLPVTQSPTITPTKAPAGAPTLNPMDNQGSSKYVGVFRAGGGVNYSNGNTYCYYRDMAAFKCMTGLKTASNFPEKPELVGQLKAGGMCSSDKCPSSK